MQQQRAEQRRGLERTPESDQQGKAERDDLRQPKSEDAAALTRPQPMTQWHRGHRHVGADWSRAAVELDDHWSRRNEVHADTLPVCLGLQHLPVDPDEAVTFEQSGPRRARAKRKIETMTRPWSNRGTKPSGATARTSEVMRSAR